MTRRVALYLVGSVVLVSLAGCGRGFFQTAEREPWRAEAEAACLKSGQVKETADLVRIRPINGPGICGAEFPLRVSALGDSPAYGFVDEDLRPPASVGRNQPRWPIAQPSYPSPSSSYPETPVRQPAYGSGANGPVSLTAPGVHSDENEIELPPEGTPDADRATSYPPPTGRRPIRRTIVTRSRIPVRDPSRRCRGSDRRRGPSQTRSGPSR